MWKPECTNERTDVDLLAEAKPWEDRAYLSSDYCSKLTIANAVHFLRRTLDHRDTRQFLILKLQSHIIMWLHCNDLVLFRPGC